MAFKVAIGEKYCINNFILDITEWSRIGYADVDKTVLSLVGSLVFGFTVGSSVITSPLIARFGYRKMGLIGVTTGIIALLLTMWVNNFYWWFITYSVSFGISNNLLYNTGMQMCNSFFPTDYNTAATVIASFGISLGTMVMNPLSVYLTDNFGWRYRFAACAAILAFLGYPCCFYWTQPRNQDKERKISRNSEEKEDLVDSKTDEVEMVNPADTMNLFSSVVFWAWCFGTTFWSLDFVIPLDFAINFMTENGIPRQSASFVMTALGIAELVSRTLCAVTGEQRMVLTRLPSEEQLWEYYVMKLFTHILGGKTDDLYRLFPHWRCSLLSAYFCLQENGGWSRCNTEHLHHVLLRDRRWFLRRSAQLSHYGLHG